MFAFRTVTARQFVELLARGERVSIVVEFSELDLVTAEFVTNSPNSAVSVRWADGNTGAYHPNEKYEIVDWAATDELREAEAEAEYEAERAVERFFEEGPNGPQDDPRERELWALEDEAREARDNDQATDDRQAEGERRAAALAY